MSVLGTGLARHLRRTMTEAERRLWYRLRNGQLGVKFRRQLPIDRYVADFASEEAKLVVEVDGSQHALSAQRDAVPSAAIEARGYLVLRFWNNDVLKETDAVVFEIMRALESRNASGIPSPIGRGLGALGAKRLRRQG